MRASRLTGRLGWLLILAVILLVLSGLSIAFGVRAVTIEQIVAALGGDTSGVAEAAVTQRIPRTILALIVGAALALSGTVMQAVTRNPIADPGILGVSGGAAFAVVLGIAFAGLTDPIGQLVLAVVGASVTAVFVYSVGSLGRGGATPLKLALAGAATSAALSSLVTAILLPRVDILQTFQFWQIGGVGGATWERISLVAPALTIAMLAAFALARGMNSLALGDDLATGLGENVTRTRVLAAAAAVVLAGAATAVAGPIGFVGLVVPHACRLLVGTDHRWLLPFSALVGAALLLAADIIGRLVARPEEIQLGIVTALVGAPFFIAIVRQQKVREL